MVPLTREKRPDEKKLEMIGRENRKKLTANGKRRKKNAIRTRNRRDREKRKRKREKQRKKKMEKKEIYKGRNTHSPLPHCTRI